MELTGRISEYMDHPHSSESRKLEVRQKLQELRKRSGLTQREVCEIICVTPQTYSGYEKGKYEPTMETIVRLSMLYNVTTDYILCSWVDDSEAASSYFDNICDNESLRQLKEEVAIMRHEIEELKKHST